MKGIPSMIDVAVAVSRTFANDISWCEQDRICFIYGLCAYIAVKHVNSYDGQHLCSRYRTKRERVDETSNTHFHVAKID